MDIAALKTELTAGHPGTGAYNASASLAADELNLTNRTVSRDTVTGSEILNATDDVEFSTLPAADKSSWLAVCAVDSVNTSAGIAKAMEADLFGPGTTTRSNLVAVKNSTVSRATELGLGFVRPSHVEQARAHHG